ncbi:MAG: (2Fe-2S)-binding protein [Nitrososphaeria archaeon]|nr:(2Fe-2S)-binding protein [Conexivisphaerales archaeon]
MAQMLVKINVNGVEREVLVDPDDRLLDVLREDFGFKSVKEACGTGDCGLCTVLMDGKPVLSCLIPAFQAKNHKILTLEGLNNDPLMKKIQDQFREHQAAQCGFCTPAMEIMGWHLLNRKKEPSKQEIKEAISGTLCRCTGYYDIVDAIYDAGREQ